MHKPHAPVAHRRNVRPAGIKRVPQNGAVRTRHVSSSETEDARKKNLSQSDVPSYSLAEALKVPTAILEHYAGDPTPPLAVAQAMELQPASSNFRMRCTAAIAYGLTEGGWNATQIQPTALAKRIIAPTVEGDDQQAKKEAFLRPRVIGLFLTKYDGAKFPRDDIAKNVLQEAGIPRDATARTLELIASGARELGLLAEIKGSEYVSLATTRPRANPQPSNEQVAAAPSHSRAIAATAADTEPRASEATDPPNGSPAEQRDARMEYRIKRVFISHGKDRGFLEPIKKILSFGDFEPVVSIEQQTVSQPVPDKIMSEMRSAGAAIIHVALEVPPGSAPTDQNFNPNVLIEIGAAMALFGKRFILLVCDGVRLPSNLQGLYEVRYPATGLDASATLRLLEAINDIKNHPLPI